MKKIILALLFVSLLAPFTTVNAEASIISDRAYRAEVRREQKQDIKLIKELFKTHKEFANKHNSEGLKPLYADNYINNDGFNKTTYFKSVDSTWETCKDLTYDTKILSIDITGENASVEVLETASGTISEMLEAVEVAGEIHSRAEVIYHLIKINGKIYYKHSDMLGNFEKSIHNHWVYQIFSFDKFGFMQRANGDMEKIFPAVTIYYKNPRFKQIELTKADIESIIEQTNPDLHIID
jgi:hypothetical protein